MREIPAVVLETVLKQDGIVLQGNGAERETRCWNPNHEDSRPSMRVNVQKGLFHCHGCNISGNVINYLRDRRNMNDAEIAAFLKDQGWGDDKIEHNKAAAENTERSRQARPSLVQSIPEEITFQRQKCSLTNRYDYYTTDGELIGVVARYFYKNKKGEPDKTFRQYTPAKTGGFWCCGPITTRIPVSDRAKRWPLYNLMHALEIVKESPEEWIWVVEGEKCCELLAAIKDRPKGPLAVVSLSGGAATGGKQGNFEKHDLTPLHGSQVMIVADADPAGRKFARQLGAHIVRQAPETRVVCVLPEDADGYDVGDAVAAGGYELAEEWLRGQKRELIELEGEKPDKPVDEGILDNPHFEVRGLHQHTIVFRLKKTHENYFIPRAGAGSEGHLIALAPLPWWRTVVLEGRAMTRLKKSEIADTLTREAERKGFVSRIENTIGRGAFLYEKQVHFNAGDRVLAPDGHEQLTHEIAFEEVNAELAPGYPVAVKDHAQAEEYAHAFTAAIVRYRFAHELDARAFVGWVATSLIGGALPFRPMLWLAGPPNSGKTFLLESVLWPLLGQLHANFSDVTEAALISQVGGDSIPVLLDEAEPERKSTMDLVRLVRLATSGRGQRARGTADGGSFSYHPRFSMLFSSIARPQLAAAESQRIYPISLSAQSLEEQGKGSWPEIRDAILDAVDSEEKTEAIRSYIILNAQRIRASAIELTDRLLNDPHRKIRTRDAQIMGALTAGYRFMSGESDALIERRVAVTEDKFDLLNTILGHMIRFGSRDGTRDIPLSELLFMAKYTEDGRWNDREKPSIDKLTRSYGLSLVGPHKLAIAPTVPAMKQILSRTQWAQVDLREHLANLGGEVERYKDGKVRRLFCNNRQFPCLFLGKDTLDALGLVPPEPGEHQRLSDDMHYMDDDGSVPF